MPESSLEFRLITKAELEGAKQLESSLQKQIGQAKALGEDYTKLDEKLKKVQASIQASSAAQTKSHSDVLAALRQHIPLLDSIASGAEKITGIAAGSLAAGLGLLAGAFTVASKGLREWISAEEKSVALDVALAQRGQLTDQYRQRLHELAEEMQRLTGIDNETWIAALSRLTQFGADASNIDKAAEAVKNLAGILGGDLQQASVLVSRALQGNFQMFARYGIHVQDAGTQTEKLNKLFEDLALRGGGQLEARMRTLGGQSERFTVVAGELLKGIGGWIADFFHLNAVLEMGADALEFWSEKIAKPIPKLDGLRNAAKSTTQSIDEGVVPAGKLAKNLSDIGEGAGKALDGLNKLMQANKELADHDTAVANAEKAKELQLIDTAEAMGRISHEQALLMKAGVEEKYSLQEINRLKQSTDEYEKNADAVKAQNKVISDNVEAQIKADEARLSETEKLEKQIGKREQIIRLIENEKASLVEAQEAYKKLEYDPGLAASRERTARLAQIEGSRGILEKLQRELGTMPELAPPTESAALQRANLAKVVQQHKESAELDAANQKSLDEEVAKRKLSLEAAFQVFREHGVARLSKLEGDLFKARDEDRKKEAEQQKRIFENIRQGLAPGAGTAPSSTASRTGIRPNQITLDYENMLKMYEAGFADLAAITRRHEAIIQRLLSQNANAPRGSQ